MLVSVPAIVAPDPLAAIPVRVPVLFLVQLNVVPATLFGLVILIWEIACPEHIVWLAGVALTVGAGLITRFIAALLQPGAVEHST